MLSRSKTISRLLSIVLCLGSIYLEKAQAQTIVPANDGTATIVTSDGKRFDITGGTLSQDGANLFQSFQKFGLNAGQIANFLSNPQIRNILGRVVGGDTSIINGLVQVTGGNSNLYLMNSAGFVFGPNAQINVPADFTVTTANGIQFDDQWFNAVGSNNYADLVGNPSAFAFTMEQPGGIINAGNLSVNSGQNLTLLGGSVLSTGQLSSPEGQLIVTAVPGKNLVRITPKGSPLSLEISSLTPNSSQPNNSSFPIASLPDLLTTGNAGYDLGAKVNPDGTIKLTVSDVTVPVDPGTTIVAGKVDVSGKTGGKVGIFGSQVGLVGTNIDASGTNGGGTVLIGGDYKGEGNVPNALRTFVSRDSVIDANAVTDGDGGRVIVWSDKVTGFYGDIKAGGGLKLGNGGFVEISGKENLIFDGRVNVTASNGNSGTLLLDPKDIIISNEPSTTEVDGELPDVFQGDFANTDININAANLQAQAGNIRLEATNDIIIADGVSLDFVPGESIDFIADADGNNVGDFKMDPTQSITAPGRNLTISAANIILEI